MENFTPLAAVVGGALIGLSAALLWVGNGRIAGISGIASTAIQGVAGRATGAGWRMAFTGGMIAAPLLYLLITGKWQDWAANPPALSAPLPVLVLGGLLVGFGTRLGSGCTSGHGVCGIARLSVRSLVATGLFMASAVITVFVMRHLLGM